MAEPSVVIADAGPLIALSIAGHVELLHQLFRMVIVPESVRVELERGKPRAGWDVLQTSPWMECRAPAVPPDHLLIEELDPGEADAIAVALEVPGSIVMLDDLRARRLAAQVYGLDVLGTVGILVRARRASLIGPLRPILVHLSTAGVYLTPSLIDAAVKSVGDS